ncbi:DinB family protein [Aquibacillus rhizosphaerae]|uniref:DinB family protein n=1 Tax=Aquibacillus rhizosphaerae TaxID=3051431 RepID=A0ABT7L5L5_9BACI|nr:DinB family protein [Aquibacillus sp. LR5S19]MDL4840694.1 DinB family protein [Aquibacillus sp. LR5S19]
MVNMYMNELIHELELVTNTTRNLIEKVDYKDWDFRPQDNMRTLIELAHHLVLIPKSDYYCLMKEVPQDEYEKLETDLLDVTDSKTLSEQLNQNYKLLTDYILSLSEQELLNIKTAPFYLEDKSTQLKWFIEIITHMFHHRAQFFNYLKELKYEVNMFDLY